MPALHDILDRSYDAFLFDMDGTLLNSIAVVERVWSEWARRHGFEPEVFLKTIHGIRASDVIRGLGLPGVDPAHEADLLLAEEMEDVSGIVEIPGAVRFLSAIAEGRWAIVTSAPIELARRRMEAAGIPMPKVIVSGQEVKSGKPSPEGYLLGASLSASSRKNAWSSKMPSPAFSPAKPPAPTLPSSPKPTPRPSKRRIFRSPTTRHGSPGRPPKAG